MTAWSKAYDCCVECKRTDSRHASKGVCDRCRNRIKYQTDPELRARILARKKVWQLEQAEYRERYGDRDRDRHIRYCRNYHELRRSKGFRPGPWRGVTVEAPFLPAPGRVLRRYALDGEVVADVQVGMTKHEAVPLTALRRVA